MTWESQTIFTMSNKIIIKYGAPCGEYFETRPAPKEHTDKCLPCLLSDDMRIINITASVPVSIPSNVVFTTKLYDNMKDVLDEYKG